MVAVVHRSVLLHQEAQLSQLLPSSSPKPPRSAAQSPRGAPKRKAGKAQAALSPWMTPQALFQLGLGLLTQEQRDRRWQVSGAHPLWHTLYSPREASAP